MDQSFLFNRAFQASNTWQDFEIAVFKLFKSSFNFKAETLQEFKILARKNKFGFIEKVKELFDDHQIIFANELDYHTQRVIKDTLTICDKAVTDVEDKAVAWKAPEVKPNGEIVATSNKEINAINKTIMADVRASGKTMVALVGNRYSHVSQVVANNISKLEKGEANFSSIRKIIRDELAQVAKKGLPAVVTKDGKVLDIVNYTEMSTRANYKKLFLDTQKERYSEYNISLVVTTVLGDSSSICEPWQGGIYNSDGTGGKYPNLAEAEGAGHLTHIGCRHIYYPYIPNVSTKPEPIDSKTIDHNRNVRQQQRYNERQIRAWKRQNAVNPSDYNKGKVNQWQGRQRTLVKQEPQIARQYEREQI